jgi:hypothetical protein
MNASLTLKEMLLDFPTPSLQGFLGKLLPVEDILECSPEYGPGTRDSFGEYTWNGVHVCFLLNSNKIGFPAAGTISFTRGEAGWGKSESLEFRLWFLFSGNASTLDSVKEEHTDGPNGWEMLKLSWNVVISGRETNSPIHLALKGREFDSPSTLYCLKILERAKTALEKIK